MICWGKMEKVVKVSSLGLWREKPVGSVMICSFERHAGLSGGDLEVFGWNEDIYSGENGERVCRIK